MSFFIFFIICRIVAGVISTLTGQSKKDPTLNFLFGFLMGILGLFTYIIRTSDNPSLVNTNNPYANLDQTKNDELIMAKRQIQSLTDKFEYSERESKRLRSDISRLRLQLQEKFKYSAPNESEMQTDKVHAKAEQDVVLNKVAITESNNSVYHKLKTLGVNPDSVNLNGLNTLGVRFD